MELAYYLLTSSWWMGYISTDEDNRLGEDFRPHGWNKNIIDTTQFYIYLEAQV